jgi:hypothetical protein
MDHQIERRASLDVPAVLARKELARVMRAIEAHEHPYADLALHVGLHDFHLPIPGEISIPVETEIHEGPVQYSCTIKLAASGATKLFPKFSGTLDVSGLGDGASELRVRGEYKVPFGGLGAAVDSTILNGSAQRALDGLLKLIADAVNDGVKRNQKAQIRLARRM